MFSTYKPGIMTTSNDFTTCHKGTSRYVIKNFALTFSLVHISFSKNLDYPAYAEF